jgi:hypothetical protein
MLHPESKSKSGGGSHHMNATGYDGSLHSGDNANVRSKEYHG